MFNKIVVKFYGDQYDRQLYDQALGNIVAKNVCIAKIMDIIVECRRLKMGVEYFLNELKIYDPASEAGYNESKVEIQKPQLITMSEKSDDSKTESIINEFDDMPELIDVPSNMPTNVSHIVNVN